MKPENQIENGADVKKDGIGKRIIYITAPFVSLGILLLVWCAASAVNTQAFPTPVTVLENLADLCIHPLSGYTLIGHILMSLKRVCIALFFCNAYWYSSRYFDRLEPAC